MRRVLPLILALWLPLAHAGLTPGLGDLDELPLHAAPVVAVQKALAAAASEPKHLPFRFAVGAPLSIGLGDGIWTRGDDGIAIWRTRVFSAGALNLNLTFGEFELPDGAELYIYDAQGSLVQGPYSAVNHTPEGMLWTAPVLGDTAVIELRVPERAKTQARLRLAELNHGFVDITGGKMAKIGESGSCNINVACPLGDDWRDEIRSVATMSIAGQRFCTGQLVNNVREDDRPLFLTADHCTVGPDSGDLPPSSVVIIWNYQSSGCNTTNGSLGQSQSGTTFLADDQASDFTLLRLNQSPSPAYNVYFAGWDARGNVAAQSGVGIHHPSGDIKKISAFDQPVVASQVDIGDGPVAAWRVRWSQGTTEPGSSGSGLWNQDGRIVGVLTGGNASCSEPGESDFYGRLSAAWTANAASSGQLKAHLDPDNTGRLTLDGKNPGATPTPTPSPTPTPTPTASPTPSPTPTPTATPTASPTPSPTPTPTATPTASPTPPPAGGGGGGGALDLLLLGTLALALGLRRRQALQRLP